MKSDVFILCPSELTRDQSDSIMAHFVNLQSEGLNVIWPRTRDEDYQKNFDESDSVHAWVEEDGGDIFLYLGMCLGMHKPVTIINKQEAMNHESIRNLVEYF